jgi:restriction endonuclease S subunit
MSALAERGQWKVEFFGSGNGTGRSGYPVVRLGEILRERRETLDPQSFPDHIFNYLGLEHVQPLTGDLVEYQPRSGREVRSRSKVFRPGDILYGRLRPELNKVFVANEPLPEGICSGEFFVLIADTLRIRPHFARMLLASRYVHDAIAGMTTGTALPRLHLSDLLAIEVPLAPVAEQLVIESHLNAQQTRREQLRHELTRGPELLDAAFVRCLDEKHPFEAPSLPAHQTQSYSQFQLPPRWAEKTQERP